MTDDPESAPAAARGPDPAAGLRLAADLVLPLQAVTETFAILGKRGMGKNTTARVLTEELLTAGLPTVVLDPTGPTHPHPAA